MMLTGRMRSLLLWVVLAALGATADAQEILYATDGTYGLNRLLTIDSATGVVTAVGPMGVSMVFSICADVAGDRLLAGKDGGPSSLYAVDRTTGAATVIGSTVSFNRLTGLALRTGDGTLFAVDQWNSDLITVNTTTGLQSVVGPIPTDSWSLAISAAGTLYGVATALPADILTVNPTTGATASITGGVGVSFVGFVPSSPWIIGLSFRSDGVLYAVIRDGVTYTLCTVNITTGAVTRVATLSGTVCSIAWWGTAAAAAGPALPALPRSSKGKGGRGCFVAHASQADLGGVAALLALALVGVACAARRRLAR